MVSVKILDRRVARAIALMVQHRARPLGVDDLARAVNLSPSYLTRLFREQLGCAPVEYDRAQRLEHAHELIRTSFLSIKEVMAACGWNDPSHFSRDFRARFAVSPSTMRAAVLSSGAVPISTQIGQRKHESAKTPRAHVPDAGPKVERTSRMEDKETP